MGPGGGPRRGEEGQPARPRRRRLSHRHQVGLRAEAADRAGLPGGQRRRGRAGHLQGPVHPGARSAFPHRGHDDRVLRDRLPDRPSSTSAASTSGRGGSLGGRPGGGGGRAPGDEHPGHRLRSPDRRPPGRRRLHLRGGDRAPVVARRQEGLAEDQAAVPRGEGGVRLPDGRQQRGDDRRRGAHRQPGRGVVGQPGHPEPGRDADVLGVRPRGPSRRLRAAGHGDDAPADLRPRRRDAQRATR